MKFIYWFMISFSFLKYGMYTLQKATIPVSGRVMNYFEHFVDVIPGCSLVYALLSWILFEFDDPEDNCLHEYIQSWVETYALKFASALAIFSAIIQYYGFTLNNLSFSIIYVVGLLAYEMKPDLFIFILAYWPTGSLCLSLPLVFSPITFQASICFMAPCFHLLVVQPYFKNLIGTSSLAAHAYHERAYIEILCGMLANGLTAYYFRFQSADLILAFLYLAIGSLGIYANIRPSTDFGIIQFLVTSAVQYAVTLFGLLHIYTFLVFLVGCIILVLKWRMFSFSLSHFAERESWVGKLFRYLQSEEALPSFLFLILFAPAVLILLLKPVDIGGLTLLLIAFGVGAMVSMLLIKFVSLEASVRKELYGSTWNWTLKWLHRIGSSIKSSTRLSC